MAAAGRNTQSILRLLKTYLRTPVAFVDLYFNKYYFSNEEDALARELKTIDPRLFDRARR